MREREVTLNDGLNRRDFIARVLRGERVDRLPRAVFGGGLEAAVGNIVFSVDVRYDLGFADIRFESTDAKTNALMVTAGFGF